MKKIIVSEFISFDGVIEDPGGGEDFEYGGWTWDYHNQEIEKFKYDELFAADTLLLGRVTYEGFAKAWPTMKDTGDFGERMNNIQKYVVSKTLKKADWKNSKIISDNIPEEILKLKRMPGQDILIYGSANLTQMLMEQNLIDEYRLLVYPVILGEGKRLFNIKDTHLRLKLLETKAFSTDVVLLDYVQKK